VLPGQQRRSTGEKKEERESTNGKNPKSRKKTGAVRAEEQGKKRSFNY